MKSSRIVQLADLLEQEIRGSKLRPGDPYLSTDDAASKLHVSTQAANNALRILVKRGVVRRRRRLGTFIARLPDETPPSALQRVHLVVHENYLRQEGMLSDGLMLGLQGELPGSQLQFNFTPSHDGHEFANRLIADALRTDGAEGFVLVRAPLAVQRIIASSGLPAVVFGSLQPSVQSLPWIDRDQRQIGGLLGSHLLACGCRQIAALFRAELAPGDFITLDQILAVAGAGGIKPSDFTMRALPADLEAIKHAVLPVLIEGRRPLGLFCRSHLLAEGAMQAGELAGLQPGRDFELVVADVYRKSSDPPPPYAYARSTVDAEQIGHHIGRMLAQQARGEPVAPGHELLPVALELPHV